MLGKLLKYEVKYLWRILLPIYCAVLGLAVYAKLIILFMKNNESMFGYFLGTTIFALILAIAGGFFGSSIILMVRNYQSLFSKEGYLTNTLPVSADELIWSKIIVWVVTTLLNYAVVIMSILILVAGEVYYTDVMDFFNMYSPFVELLGNWDMYMILSFISLFIGMFQGVLLLLACIAVGHLCKPRLICTIGIYFGVSFVLGILVNIVNMMITNYSLTNMSLLNPWTLVPSLIISIIMIIAEYVLTKYILKNKINLE